MANKLDIINAGLLSVGADPISSLSARTVAAKKAFVLYPFARLEAFDLPIDWHFATARAQLAQRTETPAFGFNYMYNLPPGYRRVIAQVDVSGDEIEYEWRREVYINDASKQFDVMLTDENAPVYIKYIVDRPNEGVYPAWFVRVIYTNLGYMLAEPLKKDKTKAEQLFRAKELAITDADAANAIEIGRVSDKNVNLLKGNTDATDAAVGIESTAETIKVHRVNV